MEERIYLALLHTLGFTHNKLHFIFKENQNYKNFYEKISDVNLRKYGLKDNQIKNILDRKNKFSFKDIKNKISERNVNIVTVFDKEFPDNFKEISSVPFVIYVRGQIDNSQKFSIVGSRKISAYGQKIVENFIPEIGKYFTIVSGGAAGCDTWAHKASLNNNIKTISIIGTGIDQDYPVHNKKMYEKIVENNGAIISMFPIGEVGNPYNFPIRNELVASISAGTLIVEAKQKSGTLITARLCLELGKEVFAVPGDIFSSQCEGCNILIQNGSAQLTQSAQDILQEFNIVNKLDVKIGLGNITKKSFNDDIEEEIYNLLLIEKLNINEIAKKIGLDVMTLGFKMSMLEIGGLVKKSISGDYEIE